MRIHRTTPKRDFTPLRNTLIRDTRISFGAHGLLAYLLSLKDGTRVDIKSLAAEMPDGQQAIASYMRELVKAGYMIRSKMCDPITRAIRTVVEVFDTPQTPAEKDMAVVEEQVSPSLGSPRLEDPSPSPTGKKNREKNPPQPEQEPLPMPMPEPGGRDDATTEEELVGRAALILARIGRAEPKLAMGVLEMATVLPLVNEWLDRGASETRIRQALTEGLPARVWSPAAFVRNRLTRKLPPRLSEPLRPSQALMECETCGLPHTGQCRPKQNSALTLSKEELERKSAWIARLRAEMTKSKVA